MKKTGVSVEKNLVNLKMCSSDTHESGKMSSSSSSDACGDGSLDVKGKIENREKSLEIKGF